MNYLKLLSLLPQRQGIRTAVITEGPHLGHRIIFSEAMVVISCQPKDSPLAGWLPLLAMIPESCSLSLGGEKVYLELLEGQPELVLCGGGHVAQALIPMADRLGFFVTVLEDREEFADRAREAGAHRVLTGDFTQLLAQHPGGNQVYYAILTREHLFDQKCLEQILPKQWAYAGMLGSHSAQCGNVRIDELAHVAYVNDTALELTPKEYDLLLYFIENKGVALSREKILNGVWNYDYFGDLRTVDTHIKKLRAKLGEKACHIKTLIKAGYKFEE